METDRHNSVKSANPSHFFLSTVYGFPFFLILSDSIAR